MPSSRASPLRGAVLQTRLYICIPPTCLRLLCSRGAIHGQINRLSSRPGTRFRLTRQLERPRRTVTNEFSHQPKEGSFDLLAALGKLRPPRGGHQLGACIPDDRLYTEQTRRCHSRRPNAAAAGNPLCSLVVCSLVPLRQPHQCRVQHSTEQWC
jgi:hypothetical protein